MDPTQTLADMLTALDNGDTGKALESWSSLREWLRGGGSLPDFGEALARSSMAALDYRIQ